MKIVKEILTREELHRMAAEGFGNMVKAAVDDAGTRKRIADVVAKRVP